MEFPQALSSRSNAFSFASGEWALVRMADQYGLYLQDDDMLYLMTILDEKSLKRLAEVTRAASRRKK